MAGDCCTDLASNDFLHRMAGTLPRFPDVRARKNDVVELQMFLSSGCGVPVLPPATSRQCV